MVHNEENDLMINVSCGQVNHSLLKSISYFSRLAQFEKTNEMLTNCCGLSAIRLEKARKDLAENRQLILEMKSDLESIFRRIRIFKQNYITKYADIYKYFGD